jgi:hypothetical protein
LMGVVQIEARCAECDPNRTPVVPVWSAHTIGSLERQLGSPNTPVQPYQILL